ncbi:MAG: hypothetical protein LBQ52_04645 [Helicobacteraceae bacterium]|jgi:hypothetical protein|nr:hypothetical protein [Helicobacteraceae bacterium]
MNRNNLIVSFLAIIALIILLFIFAGCGAKTQIIKEYVYIDKNCTSPQEIIKSEWLKTRWIIIDANATRYYATPDGATLLTNIRSCKNAER